MKVTIVFFAIVLFIFACGNSDTEGNTQSDNGANTTEKTTEPDPKGVGPVENVVLNNPLDDEMVEAGKNIYEVKCAACHKLSDQRVVGPGWAGITTRRTPEWIMNMTLNVDEMLEKDPEARKMLKECLVRMPNQNLSTGEARDVLEFMYHNDAQVQ